MSSSSSLSSTFSSFFLLRVPRALDLQAPRLKLGEGGFLLSVVSIHIEQSFFLLVTFVLKRSSDGPTSMWVTVLAWGLVFAVPYRYAPSRHEAAIQLSGSTRLASINEHQGWPSQLARECLGAAGSPFARCTHVSARVSAGAATRGSES